MQPSRRNVLRTCGGAGTVALAGCLSSISGSSDDSTTGGTTDGTSTESTTDTVTQTTDIPTSTLADPPEAREVAPSAIDRAVPLSLRDASVQLDGPPAHAFVVGEDDPDSDPKPHHVWAWNATDGTRRVELTLTAGEHGGAEATLLSESVELASGEAVAVALREGAYYYGLTVRVDDRKKELTFEYTRFDCNDSATDVAVTDDGFEESSVTTDMDCGTTTVI